ncbi:MAG: hypothetical protein EA424_08545 [Planctomycetaceae bacterium]|nr:MAG: hypothetical protein EA424_08545 [Planctomycetaceae bacterium]
MSQVPPRGIVRSGLDAAFEADETRKSNLILRARLLRDQQDDEQASQHFAEAAEIEASLSDRCAELGLVQKALIHRFSAASCWAHAGNFYQAIAICDELLTRELPQRLRRDVEDFAGILRSRRARLYAQLSLVGASE